MNKEVLNNNSSTKHYNELLEKIVKILAINTSFIDSPGLGNGKMGIAILFYNYSRKHSKNDFGILANEIIDEIYEEISTNTPMNFEDGLAGIGWGIEYLKKDGFIEGDTNEILKDIDDIILKSVKESSNDNKSNKENRIGNDLYVKARCQDALVSIEDLTWFIKPEGVHDELFTVTHLINPENYGLFKGLAGTGLLILKSI